MKRLLMLCAAAVLLTACGKTPENQTPAATPTEWIETQKDAGVNATHAVSPTPTRTPTPSELTITPSEGVTGIPGEPTPTGFSRNPTPTEFVPQWFITPTPMPTITPYSGGGGGGGGRGGNGWVQIDLGLSYYIYERPNRDFLNPNKNVITKVDIEAMCAGMEDLHQPYITPIPGATYVLEYEGVYLLNPTKTQWGKMCDYLDQKETEEARLHPTPTPTPAPTPEGSDGEDPSPPPIPTPTVPLRDRNNPPKEVLVIDENGVIVMPPNLFTSNTSLDVRTTMTVVIPTPGIRPEDLTGVPLPTVPPIS